MAKVTIDKNVCKGCELCVKACPKDVLALSETELNAKGFHPCTVKNESACIGCASCYVMCPDCAITVER